MISRSDVDRPDVDSPDVDKTQVDQTRTQGPHGGPDVDMGKIDSGYKVDISGKHVEVTRSTNLETCWSFSRQVFPAFTGISGFILNQLMDTKTASALQEMKCYHSHS